MSSTNFEQDIQYIKAMIRQSREVTAGSWMFFLVWGVLVILAIVAQYVLVSLAIYHLIWLDWVAFAVIGLSFSMIYSRKLKKEKKVKTYLDQALSAVILASALGFLLTGFIFPYLNLYGWEAIPVLIAMVAGMLTFIMGGLFEWKLLKACGLIWWAGALIMCFVPAGLRSLFFIPLILIGYIWPALSLRSLYYKQRSQNA